MIIYQTKENDMLDWICWRHYGRQSGVVEIVLAANAEIAEYGSFLPAGVFINLPHIEKITQKPTIKLWD
jgi:phage tail protein X